MSMKNKDNCKHKSGTLNAKGACWKCGKILCRHPDHRILKISCASHNLTSKESKEVDFATSELKLWKQYTDAVNKHNDRIDKFEAEHYLEHMAEEKRKRLLHQELVEDEKKKIRKRFDEIMFWEMQPWYKKLFSERPEIIHETWRLRYPYPETIYIGSYLPRKQATYEGFLNWQLTGEL